MKPKFLLIAFATLLLFSCQPESNNLELHENHTIDLTNAPSDYETAVLENEMQWAAFVIADLVHHDTIHRSKLRNSLSYTNTIPFEDLLGPNGDRSFISDFKTALIDYIDINNPDPDHQIGTPPPPPPPPDHITGISGEDFKDQLLESLINDNCIELFLPKGVTNAASYNTSSTGHPLTTAMNNDGILWVENPFADDGSDAIVLSYAVTTNYTYVQNSAIDIIISLRPVKDYSGTNFDCAYMQYNMIDFEDFLTMN